MHKKSHTFNRHHLFRSPTQNITFSRSQVINRNDKIETTMTAAFKLK